MKSDEELLIKTYAAFNNRDIDSVLAVMHAEVDWPNGMKGGRLRGHVAVRAYWERQWALIDPCVEPIRFRQDEDGRIAVEVHQVIRDLTGTTVSDQIVQHVYTMQGNLIQRMDIKKARD